MPPASPPPATTPVAPQFTNQLAGEKSPYLLQHQHNPVQWYPWGPAAFEKARKENKPIFLSIGYSTCHWCHVMAHECFENPRIAELMNAHFLNIKVDREERPDVDRVYMSYIQATTGGGGWPLNVFLTPELKPFLGGTYYPPEDRPGRLGFPTLLSRIAEAWKSDHADIVAHGQNVIEQLQQHVAANAPAEPLDAKAALANGLDQLTQSFDADLGGFGKAPKFPRPSTLDFLFRCYARLGKADPAHKADAERQRDAKAALGMALLTLRKMAEGGMHDHLAGGFHRYSVDKFWHVPHFEKMLYDQAQLAVSYLEAFQITGDPQYQTVARDILDYVRRDLSDPAGGFYSAEDADSLLAKDRPEHGEGAFCIWSKAEIDQTLGAAAAPVFNRFYGVEANGNAPKGSDPQGEFTGKNILIQRLSLAQAAKEFDQSEQAIAALLSESRGKLLAVRAQRPKPHLDDKIITAWNGLMISAFARAAQVLDDPAYLLCAQRSAHFIQTHLWKNGSLIRSYRQGPSAAAGFADDYAALIRGLLDLYEADFDVRWLQWALELQKQQDHLFADPEHGGYFSAGTQDPHILLRIKEAYDGAEPSANSLSALNLLRLSQLTVDDALRQQALKTIGAFADQLTRAPSAMPEMLCALDASQTKPLQIVIAGPANATDTRAMLQEVRTPFIPHRLVLLADGGPGQQWLGERLGFLRDIKPVDGKATAYLCEDYTCKLPTNDRAKIRELLLPK